jgi:hypothetical protein
MRYTNIEIKNYRALKLLNVPLSNFGCLIGENNAGKSSVLQCISLFKSGTKLKASDHYTEAERVSICMELIDIQDNDLMRVDNVEHRERFRSLVEEGKLKVTRLYDEGGGGSNYYVSKLLPRDERFTDDNIKLLITGKSGDVLRSAVVSAFPELNSILIARPTQAAVKASIAQIIEDMPSEEKEERLAPLPTGLDKSLTPLLPEIIYIPAVKDVADDIKTTESASFGKLIKILFDEIEHEFADIEEQFLELQKKLSRIVDADGNETDNRLAQVKTIETTIENYIKDNFPQIKLKLNVPAPELRTVLSSAELMINDGYEGPVTSKGDGLKRAVTFAILRAYAEIRSKGLTQTNAEGESEVTHSYFLLFEEPELYLYPKAQQQLFNALGLFAEQHTVLVTTHSPTFFKPNHTTSFSKLKKVSNEGVPYTENYPVDLSSVDTKNQFQLINFENNNIAFFSNKVVLVEGDSDYIVLPYIAQLINPAWNTETTAVSFARISGKTSVARYKNFFRNFGIEVMVICDLDTIVKDFDKLLPSQEASEVRGRLMSRLSDMIRDMDESSPTQSRLGSMARSGSLRSSWNEAAGLKTRWEAGECSWEELQTAVESFFNTPQMDMKTALLANPTDVALKELKRELFVKLSLDGIFILSRGAIESYYPHITGGDKVEKSMRFCEMCTTTQALNASFDNEHHDLPVEEFRGMFTGIFNEPSSN